MTARTKCPSGRPIRDRYIKASPYRSAPVEPLTPGLRKPQGFTQAIGFTSSLLKECDHEDGES